MATHDALLLFREALAAGRSLIPTTSSTPSPNATEAPLSQATHLQFSLSPSPVCLPLDIPTRYVDSNGEPFDLRSVYFAYRHHQVTIVEYNAKVKSLNDEIAASGSVASRRVQGVSFVERLELVTWLEGADECDRIKPLEGAAAQAAAATTDVASSSVAATGGVGATGGRSGKGALDPRLQAVYNGERKMGDRNTVLRGIKPTDFSHVRKLAAQFVVKKPSNGSSAPSGPGSQPSSLPLNPKAPRRRPDPIILLSQSASSLLRASNIKSFLEDGQFVPPDMSNTGINRLHIMRTVKDIDPHRPTRFILVEGTSDFKPNYWNQVVAVFTTGQEWQFKSYRWSNANELFKHVLGVFVGYRGEEPPENVRIWGHRIMVAYVERPREKPAGPAGQVQTEREPNYRDREAADNIWRAIETNMRNKGWRRDACPTAI